MLVFKVCGVRQYFNMFGPYRNPDLDGRISDSLLTSMAAVQAEDVFGFYLLFRDLNSH